MIIAIELHHGSFRTKNRSPRCDLKRFGNQKGNGKVLAFYAGPTPGAVLRQFLDRQQIHRRHVMGTDLIVLEADLVNDVDLRRFNIQVKLQRESPWQYCRSEEICDANGNAIMQWHALRYCKPLRDTHYIKGRQATMKERDERAAYNDKLRSQRHFHNVLPSEHWGRFEEWRSFNDRQGLVDWVSVGRTNEGGRYVLFRGVRVDPHIIREMNIRLAFELYEGRRRRVFPDTWKRSQTLFTAEEVKRMLKKPAVKRRKSLAK